MHELPDNSVHLLELCSSVSGTDSCNNSETRSSPCKGRGSSLGAGSTAALDVRVVSILDEVTSGRNVSGRLRQIVESVLWAFVAWTPTLSLKERGRFVRSARGFLGRLSVMDEGGDPDVVQDWLKVEHNMWMCAKVGDATEMLISRKLRLPDGISGPAYSGWMRSKLHRMLARKSASSLSFFVSLYESKRGWPELGQSRLEKAFGEHRAAFSRLAPSIDSSVVSEVVHTARAVFGQYVPGDLSRIPEPTKMTPSSHACRQSTTKKGGAYGLFAPMKRPTDGRLGLPAWVAALNDYRQNTLDLARIVAAENVERHQDTGEWNTVKVVGIAEPAKFRLISIGDGYTYTALQPLQGQLLDSWKRQPASTMLGDLQEKVDRLGEAARAWDFEWWCSGDYKSATDMLNLDAQLLALRGWARHPLYDLAVWSLTRNRLVYPDGGWTNMSNGQLMGHPLSFPLLCAINLGCFRAAVKKWAKVTSQPAGRVRAQLSAVLVNGDDILFCCDRELFAFWVEASAAVGFVLSLGKNYFSKSFAMINSKRFLVDRGRLRLCTYLNLKLVKGFSLKTGESAATPEMIGRELNVMISGCPRLAGVVPAAFRRFDSEKFGFRPNWFFPVHLGGFGVDPRFADADAVFTREQRLVAARFVSDGRLALYRRLGAYASVLRGVLPEIPATRLVAGPEVPAGEEFRFPMCGPHFEGGTGSSAESWGLRLSAMARALLGPIEPVPILVAARRLTAEYRLTPMRLDGLRKWWVAHEDDIRLGVLPQQRPLRLYRRELIHQLLGSYPAIHRELKRSAVSLRAPPTASALLRGAGKVGG